MQTPPSHLLEWLNGLGEKMEILGQHLKKKTMLRRAADLRENFKILIYHWPIRKYVIIFLRFFNSYTVSLLKILNRLLRTRNVTIFNFISFHDSMIIIIFFFSTYSMFKYVIEIT